MLYILLLSGVTSKSWKKITVLEETQTGCELVWDFQVWMSLPQFVQKLPSTHLYRAALFPGSRLPSWLAQPALESQAPNRLGQNPSQELELCSKTGTPLWVCVTKLPFGGHARGNVCSAEPQPCKPGQGRHTLDCLLVLVKGRKGVVLVLASWPAFWSLGDWPQCRAENKNQP